MPANQSTYFKRRVLPVILKQVQKGQLIQKYYTDIYQNRKKTCLQNLRQGFVKCFAFFQKKQEQIQEELKVSNKDTTNLLFKIIKIARWYRNIKAITKLYKTYKNTSKMFMSNANLKQLEYLQDQSYNNIQQEKLRQSILGTEGIIVQAIKDITTPTVLVFNQYIQNKFSNVWMQFGTGLIKAFILPDWEDPIDITLWAFSMALTLTGVGAGAGILLRLGTVLYKVFRPLLKLLNLSTPALKGLAKMRKTVKFSKASKVPINWSIKGIAKGAAKGTFKFATGWQGTVGFKTSLHAFKANIKSIRAAYKRDKFFIHGIKMYNIDESDVRQMETDYRNKLQPIGAKLESKATTKLQNLGQDISFIQQVISQAANDTKKLGIKIVGQGGYLGKFNSTYNGAIRVMGVQNLPIIDTFNNLRQKIKNEIQKPFCEIINLKLNNEWKYESAKYPNEKTDLGKINRDKVLSASFTRIGDNKSQFLIEYKKTSSKKENIRKYKLIHDSAKYSIQKIDSTYWGNSEVFYKKFINSGKKLQLTNIEIVNALFGGVGQDWIREIGRHLSDEQFEKFHKGFTDRWNSSNSLSKSDAPKEMRDFMSKHYENWKNLPEDIRGKTFQEYINSGTFDVRSKTFDYPNAIFNPFWEWCIGMSFIQIIMAKKGYYYDKDTLKRIFNGKPSKTDTKLLSDRQSKEITTQSGLFKDSSGNYLNNTLEIPVLNIRQFVYSQSFISTIIFKISDLQNIKIINRIYGFEKGNYTKFLKQQSQITNFKVIDGFNYLFYDIDQQFGKLFDEGKEKVIELNKVLYCQIKDASAKQIETYELLKKLLESSQQIKSHKELFQKTKNKEAVQDIFKNMIKEKATSVENITKETVNLLIS